MDRRPPVSRQLKARLPGWVNQPRVRGLLGPLQPLVQAVEARYLAMRTSTYVISYPKSGRTWLRHMMGVAMARHLDIEDSTAFEPMDLARLHGRHVPWVEFDHDGGDLPRGEEPPRPFSNLHSKRVLLLVRDPLDVAISWYFHRTRRLGEVHELEDFVFDEGWGVPRIVSFMNERWAARDLPRELRLARYEDLRRDPVTELAALMDWIGFPVGDRVIRATVDETSFDRMRTRSLDQGADERLAPTNAGDPESFKVRRGEVGGYVQYLEGEALERARGYVTANLDPAFGYS